MKILFVRHGESVDDLTNQYGGWADFPLTPKGYQQLQTTAKKIEQLGINFNKVLTSPLSRAIESGRVIANQLSLPQEEFLYLKEKNGYGLLSGLNKDFAEENYPDLVKEMKDEYAFGAEPHEKFIERVKLAVEKIKSMNQDLIAVTHGGFMNQLFNEILGKNYIKAHDGGYVLLDSDDNLKILEVNGIDYE